MGRGRGGEGREKKMDKQQIRVWMVEGKVWGVGWFGVIMGSDPILCEFAIFSRFSQKKIQKHPLKTSAPTGALNC